MPIDRLIMAVVVVLGVPAVMVAYVGAVEWLVKFLPQKRARQVRPWLWAGPVLFLLSAYLIYPAINTFYLSFLDARSINPVGMDNYVFVLTNPATFEAIRNNILWLVFLTLFTVTLGLLIAILFDKVSYEAAAKAVVFIPMAISFVAAGVIWKLMYDYQPPGRPQTGTLNAIVTVFGGDPVPWLIDRTTNNPALIWVGVWMWTGFAMVILSAGLKSIPVEVLEAARVDGANEVQILRSIIIPMLGSTIAVVATTMIIFALKAFDIVYVMTSGNFGTDVLANRMYTEMFNFTHFGRASAIAVMLLIAIVPIMLFNIRRFQEQEALR